MQGVVALVVRVRSDDLPGGELLIGLVVPWPAPSYRASANLGRSSVEAVQFSAPTRSVSRATVRSWRWPGATTETHSGRPSVRITAWTFPPGAVLDAIARYGRVAATARADLAEIISVHGGNEFGGTGR